MAEKRPKSRKARGLLALAKAIKEKKTERTSGARLNVSNQIDAPNAFGTLERTMAVDQPKGLRKFAQKKVDELGLDSSKIVGEGKEGLPLLLFHRSYGDPFKDDGYWTKAKDYNYPNMKAMGQVGPGARVLVGVGKVDKIFDYDNPKQVKEVINVLRKKRLARYKHDAKAKEKLEDSLRIQRDEISRGNYASIENEQFQDILQDLGYDSFTTFEEGKNVMLLKPNEQFIPLFDPLKTSTVGFAKGGRVERNPYDYEPRGI